MNSRAVPSAPTYHYLFLISKSPTKVPPKSHKITWDFFKSTTKFPIVNGTLPKVPFDFVGQKYHQIPIRNFIVSLKGFT